MRTDRSMIPTSIPDRGELTAIAGGVLLALLAAAAALPQAVRAQEAPAITESATGDRVITGDHILEAGQVVSDIAVVGGTLTVRGEVTGNAVVVGGDLVMAETGSVLGDATVTGGRIVQNGGSIRGEMRMLDGAGAVAGDVESRATDGERRGTAIEDRIEARINERLDGGRRGRSSWFDPIRRGFADLISILAFGLVLGALGAALIFYGRPYLEVVSDTLRTSTLRSAGVGLAAGFLLVPAFVVMVVALAVSIIGIPVLLIAIPLYPLAVAGGAAMGLLAAAHAIGERTAEQQGRSFERRWSNSYSYMFTGVAMLLSPLVIASLVEMTGFLDFIGALLQVVTWAVIWVVTMAGFGAVILSRAGTRRAFFTPQPDPAIDDDLLFDDEPTRTPHV